MRTGRGLEFGLPLYSAARKLSVLHGVPREVAGLPAKTKSTHRE
jgi:hypothetical protein